MAEIKVEKKKPVWPWILAGLILLAILYFLVFAGDDENDMEETNTEQVQDTTYQENNTWQDQRNDTLSSTSNQGVSAYLSHVGDKSRMGIDHEYTNNALIHLMNAVQSKADELNINIDADMQQVRQEAQEITQNPQATNHANKIKSAGEKLTDVLRKLQEERFPNLSQDVEEVRTAVQNIEPSTLTLEQKDQINMFFNEAADVLRNMS